jgi:hypothetical protein
VQAAGGGVRATAELAPGVQLGEDDLDPGEPGLGLLVDRDAAAVVVHLGGAVGVQAHVHAGAVTGERLVDRVVDDLPEAVHQPAGVGGADVHARSLADRLEPLEDEEVLGVVGVVDGSDLRERWSVGPAAGRCLVRWGALSRPTVHPESTDRTAPTCSDAPRLRRDTPYRGGVLNCPKGYTLR